MSSRPLIKPYKVINSQSMASSITSIPTIIQMLSMPSYSYSWTGSSPVGTIAVQISNDYEQNADGSTRVAGTWTSIYFTIGSSPTLVNTAPVSGNTGTGFIDVPLTGAYAIRTIYTAGSGTGNLTAILNAKVA